MYEITYTMLSVTRRQFCELKKMCFEEKLAHKQGIWFFSLLSMKVLSFVNYYIKMYYCLKHRMYLSKYWIKFKRKIAV